VTQQSTRAVATLRQKPFGEKAKIKYAKNFVEESKDKKKRRMDPFEDTTGNNVGTLSHHHHHQN
jgi:hypothetical protein